VITTPDDDDDEDDGTDDIVGVAITDDESIGRRGGRPNVDTPEF
jgi:hypothetical protein